MKAKQRGMAMARRVSGGGGVGGGRGRKIRVSIQVSPSVYDALNRLKVDRLISGSATASYSDVISESLLRMARGRRVLAGDDGAEADGVEADGIHRQD